jgi:hypothetical protein
MPSPFVDIHPLRMILVSMGSQKQKSHTTHRVLLSHTKPIRIKTPHCNTRTHVWGQFHTHTKHVGYSIPDGYPYPSRVVEHALTC